MRVVLTIIKSYKCTIGPTVGRMSMWSCGGRIMGKLINWSCNGREKCRPMTRPTISVWCSAEVNELTSGYDGGADL